MIQYDRINFVNGDISHDTPLSADNLNSMDETISELVTVVNQIAPVPVGPDGDMKKSVYDTNNNGMVDTSDDVEAINLIPFPYAESTKTVNGITFTVNADGSITANGTATANATFYLNRSMSLVDGKTYFISGHINSNYYMNFLHTDWSNTYRNKSFVADNKNYMCYIGVPKGATLSNVTIYPMLEVGTHAHAYKPYIGYDSLTAAVFDLLKKVNQLLGVSTTSEE